ncbi:hypothetical protein NLJ89_g12318 [Agrocybe chaxingu]|uniref:Uncharacterized protein n=1 Tax=Agrocybe chaxingu TaxID=84603 RepID=A0A9W8JM32_9AGAR|nr:hypothetical protein NLJ89_g12318 [Agrocybe chaxingu]
MSTSERPSKRPRLAHNSFMDVEAQVSDDEVGDEEEMLYEEEGPSPLRSSFLVFPRGLPQRTELNEEEEAYDTIKTHAQLRQAMDDEGEDVWQSLLERAHARTARPSSFLGESPGVQDPPTTGELWEIGCTPGREEAVAFKVLARSTHPTSPQFLARAVIGRWTSIGRVYAESAAGGM